MTEQANDARNNATGASRKRVTASDIAKVLGLNQSTVSRALGNGSVSPEKRELIIKTARELGYRPNGIARGLITGKSRMIGLITSDIKNPFYPEVIERFTNALRERGFYVLFVNSAGSDVENDDITPLIEYETEGVISVAAHLSSSLVTRLQGYGFPVVLFNRYIQQSSCSAVSCDNFRGGEVVAELFIRTGHKRLAFVAGDPNTSTSRDRERGFRQALAQHSQPVPAVISGHYTYQGGYDAGLSLLQTEVPPDGIFCANDIMALGVLDAARHLGIRVPEDVSVVGFDDISLAGWKAYSLTTVRQPVAEMVNATVERLVNEIEGVSVEPRIDFIPGELVMRATVHDRRQEASGHETGVD
ncbi:LacI family DNA-binding transcriptional regulator [Alicyclobacillus fastidiosus]|uniref:LacI family DNA-binding transcriptional regulator n=1 Tax=Alicyclobacillus fastidiosus TaxID=392011 RepID=A0ABV5AGD1_9BACL|nr:LacI family DNA-binding transcriptional regulator [Alicyclobacillus fastidiosus]WEH08955.1 LacI family DNA-binding transcriptional regulator [Alicyclobacillus fastidiosus]